MISRISPIPPAITLLLSESAPNIASTLRSSDSSNSAGSAPDRS